MLNSEIQYKILVSHFVGINSPNKKLDEKTL